MELIIELHGFRNECIIVNTVHTFIYQLFTTTTADMVACVLKK